MRSTKSANKSKSTGRVDLSKSVTIDQTRLVLGAGLPMKPSEYVLRQCVISADPDEPGLDTVIDFIGDDNLVWNTDYPHPDAPDPNQVLPWFSAQPISEDSKRKILWDNAVRLYGPRLLESAP
jgi:predicted TIM-barrel fold metal-dependent hydrolase